MSPKKRLEAHAAACREALAEGRERPRWEGGSLVGAVLTDADLTGVDLTGVDLTGVDLFGADLARARLSDADLCGARFAEGEARGRAIASGAGGYRWWAVLLAGGGYLLRYGCERHTAEWWRAQGPALSVRHGHDASHWEEGPAVAIAAAEALARGEL